MGSPPSKDPEHVTAPDAVGGPSAFRVSIASLSDVGRVRSENQDGCGVFRDSHGNHLLVVADGMGGHRGGATASRVCIEIVGRVFQWSPDPVPERLQAGLVEANRTIHTMAAEDSSLAGMGTTAVVLSLGADGEGWVAWAGDSRLYRLRDGRVEPLTQDHSLVAEWVRLGVLRPEDAATHPRKNELMRCVGPTPALDPDVERIEIRPGDRFLLCSDGLWGEVADAEIGAVLGAEAPERAVRRLVDLANERGGPDNVTVQIAVADGAAESRRPPVAAPAAPVERSRAVPLAAGVALASVLLAALLWVAMLRGSVSGPEEATVAAALDEPVAETAPAEEEEAAAAELEPFEPAPVEQRAEAAPTAPPASLPVAPAAPRDAPPPAEHAQAEKDPGAEKAAPPAPAPPPLATPTPPALAAAKPVERPVAVAPLAPRPQPAPSERTAPAASAPLPPRPEFRDVGASEPAAEREAPTQHAAAVPSKAAPAGAADARAPIESFFADWTRAVETRDFARYHALGLPFSLDEFEESYGQRKEASLRFAVIDHKRVDPGLLHVRVSMTYSYRTSTGPANHSKEQKLVLREVDGRLRYAGRFQ